MSSTTPSAGAKPAARRQPVEIAEAAFDQRAAGPRAARRRARPAARAAGSRSMPSTRAPGAASGWLRCSRRRRTCRQCRSRRPSAPAPAASGEAARERGARSLSGHPRPAGRLASPSFPCSSLAAPIPLIGAAPRAEKPAMLVDFLAGARAPLLEARGLPHLEFAAEAHESDVGRKAGVGAKRFRKHDASVLIDGEDVHVTIERDRQLVALVRIIRQAVEKPVDLARKALAACIERRSIERGVAVDAAAVPACSRRARARRGTGQAPRPGPWRRSCS